ncbi:MAG: hypothetical protein HYS04_15580 [Acidobacteria bacterium]|nr:hypothetical protein [Acidobacteriota bacterium]
MKAEEYQERTLELGGWPVKITSYRIGETWHAQADNVSPGACLARISAASREDAERQALEKAEKMLGRTRVQEV